MPNPDLSPVFEALAIAPEAGAPLHRQLYEELRHAVGFAVQLFVGRRSARLDQRHRVRGPVRPLFDTVVNPHGHRLQAHREPRR